VRSAPDGAAPAPTPKRFRFADLLQWGPSFGETYAASWRLAVCLNGWDRAARAFETHPGAASTTASPFSATR